MNYWKTIIMANGAGATLGMALVSTSSASCCYAGCPHCSLVCSIRFIRANLAPELRGTANWWLMIQTMDQRSSKLLHLNVEMCQVREKRRTAAAQFWKYCLLLLNLIKTFQGKNLCSMQQWHQRLCITLHSSWPNNQSEPVSQSEPTHKDFWNSKRLFISNKPHAVRRGEKKSCV